MKELYEFGHFTLDVNEGRLLREGRPVPLKPKVLETLLVLVENSGHAMDKDELMKRLWPDSFVEEANLAVNISQLRKALGESENGEHYIETVPKRGYRFLPPVTKVLADPIDMVVREHTRARVLIEEEETDDERASEQTSEAAAALTSATARGSLLGRSARRKKLLLAVAASLVVIGGVAAGLNLLRSRSGGNFWSWRANPQDLSHQIKFTRLTSIGKVYVASISPDGKYVAYVVKDGRKQSLWLHHIATSQEVEVVPPAETDYLSVNFTPDSNYIDYKLIPEEPLYRVAVLGGPAKKIIEDILGDVAYSPDGKRLVFVRGDMEKKEQYVVLANADGTEQRVIATHKSPEGFFYESNALAWAPDAKTIIATASHSNHEETYYSLVEVNLENGSERPLGTKRWLWLMGLSWARDSGDIFITASDQSYGSCQVWRVSYPDGELKRVTNDLNGYLSLSMTDDSTRLATVQQTQTSSIWFAPNGDASQTTQISSGTTDGMFGLCVMADGRVVYTSRAGGNWDIWMMNSDGTGKKQLTSDAKTNEFPAVTPDGRYIVFSSNRSGKWGIWRMDSDGSNPTQLASTSQFVVASCSVDSKWIAFSDTGQNKEMAIWKVSIAGGEPVQLSHRIFPHLFTSTSPDGKWIASAYTDRRGSAFTRLGIIPFEGGEPVKTFDLPSDITYDCVIGWTVDSAAICYTRWIASPKIWLQPLDGSPVRELADFKTDGIYAFAWSPDGKQLALARGGRFGDAVMISNLK